MILLYLPVSATRGHLFVSLLSRPVHPRGPALQAFGGTDYGSMTGSPSRLSDRLTEEEVCKFS